MLTYSTWHEVLRLFPISGARYTIKINTLLILQYQRDVPDYSGYNTLRSSISSREKKLVPTIWRNYLCYDVSQTGTTKKNCYKHMRNRRQAWLNISGDKKQRPKHCQVSNYILLQNEAKQVKSNMILQLSSRHSPEMFDDILGLLNRMFTLQIRKPTYTASAENYCPAKISSEGTQDSKKSSTKGRIKVDDAYFS